MRQLKLKGNITARTSIEGPDVKIYLNKEEKELIKRIKSGDKEANHKLIDNSKRFIVSITKQYQNQGVSIEELISKGEEGLIIAAKKFDESRGFSFMAYAIWWIRQSMINTIDEKNLISKHKT